MSQHTLPEAGSRVRHGTWRGGALGTALAGLAACAAPLAAQTHAKGTLQQGTGPGEVRHDPVAVIQARQPTQLPPLPAGVTLDDVRAGDRLFRGKGGCVGCHGAEGEGMPDEGSGLTAGLHFVATDVGAIAGLLRCGFAEGTTRSGEGMPARGKGGKLTATEMQRVAAYVWAISQVRSEPWAGGHTQHAAPPEEKADSHHGESAGAPKPPPRPRAVTAAATVPGCRVGSALRDVAPPGGGAH